MIRSTVRVNPLTKHKSPIWVTDSGTPSLHAVGLEITSYTTKNIIEDYAVDSTGVRVVMGHFVRMRMFVKSW